MRDTRITIWIDFFNWIIVLVKKLYRRLFNKNVSS